MCANMLISHLCPLPVKAAWLQTSIAIHIFRVFSISPLRHFELFVYRQILAILFGNHQL
jgi:hypothetical protein